MSWQFADEVVFISYSEDDLQQLLNYIHKLSIWAGLEFKVKEFATLVIDGSHRKVLRLIFSLGPSQIPSLRPDDGYIYLSANAGFKLDKTLMAQVIQLPRKFMILYWCYIACAMAKDQCSHLFLPDMVLYYALHLSVNWTKLWKGSGKNGRIYLKKLGCRYSFPPFILYCSIVSLLLRPQNLLGSPRPSILLGDIWRNLFYSHKWSHKICRFANPLN